MDSDSPTSIGELLEQLPQVGFNVVAERYSAESFGNRVTVLERDPVAIRMLKDRGIWTVDVAGPRTVTTEGGDFWFSSGVWQAYLDSTDPPIKAMPLDQEIIFVKDRWQDVESAFRNDKDLDDDLRSIRKEGAEARRRLRGT